MQAKPGDIVCPAVMGTSMEQAKMRVLIDPTYYDYQVKTTSLLMTAFASCPSECSLQQHGCALSCWTPEMHICCGGSASCTMQPLSGTQLTPRSSWKHRCYLGLLLVQSTSL